MLGLELGSFVALWVNDHALPSPARLQGKRQEVVAAEAAGTAADRPRALEALHPYLGFVYDPTADSPELRALHGAPISRFGFLDLRAPIVRRGRDRLVVGIFGGSFASWTFLEARQVLVERLAASPAFAGREVVVLDLALGGYKQPQQLMALSYLLALGGELDLVVNLDGFNEMTLPLLENLPKGVFLPYPRNWYLRTSELGAGPLLRLVARVDSLRRRRLLCARLLSAPVVRTSLTANLAWRALDRALANRISRAEQEIVRMRAPDHRYVTSGPFEPVPDHEQLLAGLAAVWRDSSLQMDRLARGNGARYLHFLQPNQYVEGSKPFTAEERSKAIEEGSPFAVPTREGFPYLMAAGEELRRAGLEFHDLTRLFADVDETLYRDSCCHVNPHGSQLVAAAIADAILAGPDPVTR